ncbi:CsbD family protein [Streptomyces sp. A0592]|uniref:CsbD family protein n=1 Tax=Streptomyces sp. A0592 TaxID=2563099 RepID=UPI00109E6F80|nr:CsbD family protein [Streptomyces sp. A0592]THA74376.1 CsbD family protein [Streptomyces sp. A0592]
MSKAKGKAKQIKGKLKETAGDAMDDKRMQAEGSAERMTGKAEEKASEAADRTKKGMRRS